MFVKKRNYGVTLRFGKVRTFPVCEALGARYDFSEFVADGSRMRDVVAGQYENRHAKSFDKVSIYGKDEIFRPHMFFRNAASTASSSSEYFSLNSSDHVEN